MLQKFIMTASLMAFSGIALGCSPFVAADLITCFSPDASMQQPITFCWINPPSGSTFAWQVCFNDTIVAPSTTNPLTFFPTQPGEYTIFGQLFNSNGDQISGIADFGAFATLPPMVNVSDQCICTGSKLTLPILVESDPDTPILCTPDTAQVIVTGPECFSFISSELPLPAALLVDVTEFANAATAGCYFVTVIDSNGCTVVNQPVRVIVANCCPTQNS
jgi:hypothetical protein